MKSDNISMSIEGVKHRVKCIFSLSYYVWMSELLPNSMQFVDNFRCNIILRIKFINFASLELERFDMES